MVKNSWKEILTRSFYAVEKDYRDFLIKNREYFPDFENMFNPFKTLPLEKTRYILFGQDPYPRKESAIGYAFIDGKVKNIFDKNGLSKEVNRAVSLRNFIKMALVADGRLSIEDTSKEAVKRVKKDDLINTIFEFKNSFEKNGILLLNRALVFTKKEDTKKHLKYWKPFIKELLKSLKMYEIEFILFGNAAKDIENMEESKFFKIHKFEHPYNISFITNKDVLKFFKPFNILYKN